MTPDLQRNERIEMLMWLLTIALLAMIASVTLANAAPQCLTLKEARAKWPTQHLWHHTSERCWDTHQGRGRTYGKRESKPPEEAKPHPAPPARADANGNDAGSVYVSDAVFNEIDAQADKSPTVLYPPMILATTEPPLASMLTPTAMTKWPVILDVDAQQAFTPWAFRVAGQFN